jgi:hypothetical protein
MRVFPSNMAASSTFAAILHWKRSDAPMNTSTAIEASSGPVEPIRIVNAELHG